MTQKCVFELKIRKSYDGDGYIFFIIMGHGHYMTHDPAEFTYSSRGAARVGARRLIQRVKYTGVLRERGKGKVNIRHLTDPSHDKFQAMCGTKSKRHTTFSDSITCKKCLKEMERRNNLTNEESDAEFQASRGRVQ